jgi:hypothetical protein
LIGQLFFSLGWLLFGQVKLNISEEIIAKSYAGLLKTSMVGRTWNIFTRVLTAFTGRKPVVPGSFKS